MFYFSGSLSGTNEMSLDWGFQCLFQISGVRGSVRRVSGTVVVAPGP